MHPEVPMIRKITGTQGLKASLVNTARLSSQRATKPSPKKSKKLKDPFEKDPKANKILIDQNT